MLSVACEISSWFALEVAARVVLLRLMTSLLWFLALVALLFTVIWREFEVKNLRRQNELLRKGLAEAQKRITASKGR
jgi:hypothetical protein